ncbi:hypothetical protein DH2020_026080 [Rehmannia glutinosa]|uniref:Ribosome production factor 2 homolog n=1 Tax=Rehmannia glutinosa TaxID=99300 RepID=A0ABR0W1I9_REHGL
MRIKTQTKGRIRRELDKRAPKLVETGKKTLILHGTKTSSVLNSVLTEIYHLKKGNSIKYSRKNDKIRPFESGGEASLEFFSLKTDCSLFVFGSHSKKRPNNLVLGRTYDHHIYDLVEVGIENFRSMESFSYDKNRVLNKIFFSHCALRLKKSGTVVPRMELVEVGPSMDMVVRRHRHPDDSLRKEAMKTAPELTKKKVKNVVKDDIQGKLGKIYIPIRRWYFKCVLVGDMPLTNNVKGLKRERREAKMKGEDSKPTPKKQKQDAE